MKRTSIEPLVVAALLACGCARSEAPIRPAPEPSIPASATPPPPDLAFDRVRCIYGGTAPAFFVWAEVTAHGRVEGLTAKRFEITDATGAFVSGAASTVDVRRRKGTNGEGDVEVLKTPLEDGQTLHLEVFGPLSLAPFGKTATYPTDARAFRVTLTAGTRTWTLEGTCEVGRAG